MSRCRFTDVAKADLRDIAQYIRRDNPAAARQTVKRLREVCQSTLVMFPQGGTKRDDLATGLRAFSGGNYVIYFTGRDPVVIVRVLHGARDVGPWMFG